MARTKFGIEEVHIGHHKLLADNVFHAGFPLHEKIWQWTDEGPLNHRQVNVSISDIYNLCFRLSRSPNLESWYSSVRSVKGRLSWPSIGPMLQGKSSMLFKMVDPGTGFRTRQSCFRSSSSISRLVQP